MGILVTYPLSPQLVESGLGELVVYRPDLVARSEDNLRHALAEHCPTALLVDGNCPEASTLNDWQQSSKNPIRLIRCHQAADPAEPSLPGIDLDRVLGTPSHLPDDLEALRLAERHVAFSRVTQKLASCGISRRASSPLEGSRVTLVGAGIVNLMTALELGQKGANVEILEANEDPRKERDWRRLGATHGGENARMFCFTEADNYNEKVHSVYSGMDHIFRRKITDGGWLAVDPSRLDGYEQEWIDAFYQLPRWRAEIFAKDIHDFSKTSYPLWKELQQSHAHLFEDVGYTPGVLRLYAQAPKVETASKLHGSIGSLLRTLDGPELARRHPACADAVASGDIAGALEVRGFTLNIHDYVAKLLAHLESRGVELRWNQRVSHVERAGDDSISGLRVRNAAGEERVVRSEHYVLSPGVYGNPLLEGMRSAGKIQGILGLWLLLPNLDPRLEMSIKIHREGHVGEDSNVTVARDAAGRPLLVLGSGYGFLGSHGLDMDSPEIACLFDALEVTAQRYFPRAYQAALRDRRFFDARKACVRPFTANGLGIFEATATSEGGRLVIASGHNTGGFAQAPAVAQAVATTLEGGIHPMQYLYDPDRGTLPELRQAV